MRGAKGTGQTGFDEAAGRLEPPDLSRELARPGAVPAPAIVAGVEGHRARMRLKLLQAGP